MKDKIKAEIVAQQYINGIKSPLKKEFAVLVLDWLNRGCSFPHPVLFSEEKIFVGKAGETTGLEIMKAMFKSRVNMRAFYVDREADDIYIRPSKLRYHDERDVLKRMKGIFE